MARANIVLPQFNEADLKNGQLIAKLRTLVRDLEQAQGQGQGQGQGVEAQGVSGAAPGPPTIERVASNADVALTNDDGSRAWRVAVFVAPAESGAATDHIEVGLAVADESAYHTQSARDGVVYFDNEAPDAVVTLRARAIGAAGGASAYVYRRDYAVSPRKPAPPMGVAVTVGTFSLALSPQGGTPASNYEYWISPTDLDNTEVRDNAHYAGSGHSLTITDLQPATRYVLWVDAVNAYGHSDFYKLVASTRNDALAILKTLSGRLNKTVLAQDLRRDIDIGPRSALQNALNTARGHAQALAQTGQAHRAAQAAIQTVEKKTIDGDSALAQRIDSVTAASEANAADITSEKTARADSEKAIADRIDSTVALANNNSSAIVAEQKARTDATSALAEKTDTISTTLDGNTASIEQQAQSIDGLSATWHITLSATHNGKKYFGGFGIGAEDGVIDGIFDVDEFAIGKPGAEADIFPFIFDTASGNAYLRGAVVQDLVFTKLTDSSGNFLVNAQGRVKAQYIEADQLKVQQSLVIGAGSLASRNDYGYTELTGTKPPTNADHTGSHTASDVATGSGKAVRQRGADHTGSNTSSATRSGQSTQSVNGRPAWEFNSDGSSAIRGATADGRVEVLPSGVFIYDGAGALRVELGRLT